jgi:Nuclease-related domain
MPVNSAEQHAAQLLTAAFSRTFADVRVLTGLVVPLPAPSRIPTGEFDSIVVCNAGIFVFEVKGWKNCVVKRSQVGDSKRWLVSCQDRNDHEVVDPLAQGGEKYAGLKTYLPPRISIRYYVLLPESGVELEPTLPAGVVLPGDLAYIARLVRSQTKSSKSHDALDAEAVDLTARYLQELGSTHTLSEHIDNCQLFHAAKKAGIAPPSQPAVLELA